MDKSMEKDVDLFLTKCPLGHKFGVDTDKFYECVECMIWERCDEMSEMLKLKPISNNLFEKLQEPLKETETKIKYAEDHVKEFIAYLRFQEPLMEEAKKFLTQTCQYKSKYVGNMSYEGVINGFYDMININTVVEIKEAFNQPSPLVRDVKIKLSNIRQELIIQCRLIKESGLRKPDPEGTWGIDGASFKLISNK